jgi:hypothetical protein
MDVSRTCRLARADPGLVDRCLIWNGLRIELVDRFARPEARVEFVGYFDGTDLEAIPARVALLQVDVSGMLEELHLEIARFALHIEDFGIREDLDIGMLVHLNEPRRDGTHGAVIGRKGLVELGHAAADCALFLDQIDFVARVSQVNGGLHSADARARHKDGAHLAILIMVGIVIHGIDNLYVDRNRFRPPIPWL